MKKNWWKVPIYCIIASLVCFQLEIRLLGRWAIITLPDGSVSSDNTRWLIMSACLFVLVVAVGVFFIFRKMSRKEVLYSALVLVCFNIVIGLLGFVTPFFSLVLAYCSEWQSVISQLLFLITDNKWIHNLVFWILPPFVFVPFGKKEKGDEFVS